MTFFTQKAQRFRGPNALWLFLAFGFMVVVLMLKAAGFAHWTLLMPIMSVFIILYLTTRNRKEDITFLVHRDDKNELYFSYNDEDHLRTEDVRIEEFDYWYYTEGGSEGNTNYVLIMQAGDDSGLYYFKEKITGKTPPANWPYRKEMIPDQKNILLIPELQKLAVLMEKHAT